MIIETTANRFYAVIETGKAGLEHVWYGREVKFDKKLAAWVRKGPVRAFPELVRKAATKVVSDATIGVLHP